MSFMREVPYLLTAHYIVIAMRPISFPITLEEIIEKVGNEEIRTSPDKYTPFREILQKMPLDRFSCAAEFYCALNAS
jgi:hypothetical protein